MNFWKPILIALIGLTVSLTGLYINEPGDSWQNLASVIGENISNEIKEVDHEAAGLLADESRAWESLSHSFFVMDSTSILHWNKNEFAPDVRTVQDDFSIRLLRWPRGIFLLKKWSLKDGKFLLAVITFQNRYKINNQYLISGWNEKIFPVQEVAINDSSGEGDPFVWNGSVLFKVKLTSQAFAGNSTSKLGYMVVAFGIVLLTIGFGFGVNRIHSQGGYGKAFLYLLVFFVGGRVVMLLFFTAPDLTLFDPNYFASSGYNRSIGDLFINTVVIAIPIAYLFYNYYRFKIFRPRQGAAKGLTHVLSILLVLACFFAMLLPFLFFETISHNSSILLDATRSLHFDELRIFSLVAIIIGCGCSFMLLHILFRLVLRQVAGVTIQFIAYVAAASLIFYMVSLLAQRDYTITLFVSIGYLLCLWVLNLPKYLRRTTYTSFLYLFVAIVTFATQGALSVKKFAIEDKISSQFRFANTFLTDRDYLGEYLLNESAQRISSDPFIQTRLGSPFLSKAVVRQKVKQVYLNPYFDKYDIQVYLFNSSGISFDNSTGLGFSKMITNFQEESSKTGYEGVYFLKNSTPESTKRYLVVVPINRFALVTGYIVLDLSLKRVIPRNIFPELLLDDRFIQYFKNRDFSYAFYVDDKVQSSFGNFNYEMHLPVSLLSNSNLFDSGLTENNFIHVGLRDEQRNITLVSSPAYAWFSVITNFSFLFTLGLFIILAGLLVYRVVTLYQRKELNYSARIQLYVYLAFILPLVLVSATTIGLIGQSAEDQLKSDYVEKSRVLGERLAPLIDVFQANANITTGDLENQLIELAKLANVDASIFLPSGKLLVSSQPLIYEDRILSSLMDRNAFEAISRNKEQSFVNNEQIGRLTYNSSYYALRSPESGELTAILSLPFFESAHSLEKTQISVVANIITIFSLVFIMFSVLSFFAVRWLTFPLELITTTLRRTTFTGSNKPLVWRANDEIGMMVNEYNKMVENLEQSKIEISRIQKESAWREIAKQVAHEVKNPLTPMKLTLQQLEVGIIKGELKPEQVKKSVATLLEQVHILNEIASSFSAFARMPAPILQKIELTSLVRRVVDLHSDYQEGTVKFVGSPGPVFVMGDDQLLSRVFSNIILNALQSSDDRKIDVVVRLNRHGGSCSLSFEDNGDGIAPDAAQKIFLPHFSTKKSGSGIGLAIAKQGIEQSGGTIRFETRVGKGTTFYVEIPTI